MLVLVCGSRSWDDVDAIRTRLLALPTSTRILHGGAPGADQLAGSLAERLGFEVLPPVRPDWKSYGRRAGILRNLAMLDERPDLVLAFWDGASPGTAHTVREARRRGIEVVVVTPGSKPDQTGSAPGT